MCFLNKCAFVFTAKSGRTNVKQNIDYLKQIILLKIKLYFCAQKVPVFQTITKRLKNKKFSIVITTSFAGDCSQGKKRRRQPFSDSGRQAGSVRAGCCVSISV